MVVFERRYLEGLKRYAEEYPVRIAETISPPSTAPTSGCVSQCEPLFQRFQAELDVYGCVINYPSSNDGGGRLQSSGGALKARSGLSLNRAAGRHDVPGWEDGSFEMSTSSRRTVSRTLFVRSVSSRVIATSSTTRALLREGHFLDFYRPPLEGVGARNFCSLENRRRTTVKAYQPRQAMRGFVRPDKTGRTQNSLRP